MGITKIEWTATINADGTVRPGYTFNPWVGCTKVSGACDFCYAEGWAKRTGNADLWQGERRRTSDANWRKPLKWDAEAARLGVRHRVFCASLADVFDNQVPREWRADLWLLIKSTPHLDWLLLTKRPQNIAKMLPDVWGTGWPNVWLGTTAENQAEADRRIPHLLAAPAAVRFISAEPLLGPIDLTTIWLRRDGERPTELSHRLGDYVRPLTGNFRDSPRLGWIIVGGESGRGARPMHPDWARAIRDQCAAAGVPFFFKQWGAWGPADSGTPIQPDGRPASASMDFPYVCRAAGTAWMREVGKARAGRLLDGREHNAMPERAS